MWCGDEEDELLAAAAAAYIIFSRKKKKRRKYKLWMRSSLQGRNEYGGLCHMNSLRKDDLLSEHIIDGHIQNFIRISSSDLEWLLSRVEPFNKRQGVTERLSTQATQVLETECRPLLPIFLLILPLLYRQLMFLFLATMRNIEKHTGTFTETGNRNTYVPLVDTLLNILNHTEQSTRFQKAQIHLKRRILKDCRCV